MRPFLETQDSFTPERKSSDHGEGHGVNERRALRNHVLGFVICMVLGVCFTLPGSLSPRSVLLGYSGDNYQHAWFLWHFATAVTHGQNPFYTRLIFYPHRVNLAWSTTDPLAGILALPFSVGFGPVFTYNLSLILQLALAAFFARLLCLRVCGNEVAALIGGICFGFSPFLLAHALGHLSLVTAFPIPLYVLALDRLLRETDPSWKDGLLLGLALLLTSLGHYNYTVFCLMLTAVVIAVDLFREGAGILKRIWAPLTCAAVAFLVSFSPFLIMLLGNPSDVPQSRPLDHLDQFSADVLGFAVPSWNHLLLGHFARNLDPGLFVAGFEGTVYIGPVILLLACIGFWKGRALHPRWTARAAVAAIFFYLLSLGPHLRIWGRQLSVPGPAFFFYRWHFAQFVSAPARFHIVTILFLSVLSSIGLAFLMTEIRSSSRRWLLVSVVGAALLLDLLTIPFPASSIIDPAWAAGVSDRERACVIPPRLQERVILTFPLTIWPYSPQSMWMQLSDGGRYSLVDGYVSYGSANLWDELYRVPLVRSLRSLQGELSTPVNPGEDRKNLPSDIRELNLSAIVVFDSAKRDAAVSYLEEVLGRKGFDGGSCTVFGVLDSSPNNPQ